MNQEERITKQIERLERARELCRKIEPVIPVDYVGNDGNIIIKSGDTPEALRETRSKLREALGKWEDKRAMVWESLGVMIVSYRGNEQIEIWMSFPVEDVPDFIVGDCEIVERQETCHVLVCKKAPG